MTAFINGIPRLFSVDAPETFAFHAVDDPTAWILKFVHVSRLWKLSNHQKTFNLRMKIEKSSKAFILDDILPKKLCRRYVFFLTQP